MIVLRVENRVGERQLAFFFSEGSKKVTYSFTIQDLLLNQFFQGDFLSVKC